MKLTESISLVGSGDIGGFSLTNPFDCHIYLLNGETELALIDAGAGIEIDSLFNHITADGYHLEDIKFLLVTHSHFDHAGGAARLRRELGVQVVASKRTAAMLSTGDAESSGLAPLQRAGLYPRELVFEPCPVDVVVQERTEFSVGSLTVRALSTPGHSVDHFAYLTLGRQQDLFCGDSILAGGKILIQNLPDVSLDDYRETIIKLSEIDVSRLLPGHGLITLARANRHIRTAKQHLERFQFPGNGVLD